MPPFDAIFSTPLGGWKASALHSTFFSGKCERFWTLPSGPESPAAGNPFSCKWECEYDQD